MISTGPGHDLIDVVTGTAYSWASTWELGGGNDRIKVHRHLIMDAATTISTGAGDDLVEARLVGELWDGGGWLRLGPGADRLIGFADSHRDRDQAGPDYRIEDEAPHVVGGLGLDALVLPTGVYRVERRRIWSGEACLVLRGIERLEGIAGGAINLEPGTLTVDPSGLASFSPLAAMV